MKDEIDELKRELKNIRNSTNNSTSNNANNNSTTSGGNNTNVGNADGNGVDRDIGSNTVTSNSDDNMDGDRNSRNYSTEDKGEKKSVEVTAYVADCEGCSGITASGVKPQAGVTVACPPSVPFGTRVHIEGVGERVCQDRGGAISEGKLDLLVGSKEEAVQFGRQRLEVEIISEGKR